MNIRAWKCDKKNAYDKKKKRSKKGFEGLPLDQMVIQW